MIFFVNIRIFIEMNLNVDNLISFFNRHTPREKSISEQDAPAAGGSSASSGKTPKKWESGRKFGKTYMNDPKYVWKSDRVMGKTGGSDYA
jgi:hypothetical protein